MSPAPIPAVRLDGFPVPVSRLVMGTMPAAEKAHALADDFFSRGGNAFDTAYIYGGGQLEKDLGAWMKARGVRDRVALIVKGAHTPHCNPEALSKQLLESLDRLQTGRADLYFMHRDNPDVPVGEFVDVLNSHAKAGRLGLFGGSNWTMARIDEANAWAKAKGLQGFGALSNNLSLARMVEAPWGGCLACNDPAWRAWFARTRMPLFAWSSQARGFFVRGDPAFTEDKELTRCWYAPDNFERLKRVRELAASLGVEPVNVALAWVLAQPTPTFALIGPQSLAESESCARGAALELTDEQVRRLNLEA